MPIPKKRASLNTSNDDEKAAKDLLAGVKDKMTKDNDKDQDKEKIKEPETVAPPKTVNAPKSSKRGRGRSRK